jgi:hypothetical protein
METRIIKGVVMSVSLFIKYQTVGKETDLVAIATEKIFEEYWQPASATLGLKWIPLFQVGLPLNAQDVPDIEDELLLLKEKVSSGAIATIPESIAKLIVSRIDELIPALRKVQENPDAEGYVG